MPRACTTNSALCPTFPLAIPAEARLRTIPLRYAKAVAGVDGDSLDGLTALDFLFTGPAGDWLERGPYLAALREASVSGRVSCDDAPVRLFGKVAVLHGVVEADGGGSAVSTVRRTIVCRWDGADWRMVGVQDTALRDGVAKPQRLGSPPVCAAWPDRDPSGDDRQVLQELNAHYVRAFRECDLAWYDAHLAPDYVVINSDGSFDDRARALAEFAQPVFTLHMRSFPVDRVRIRRFDDVALIHAENAYELLDGRRGVNRYTDIWHKQEYGLWHCVAAHITPHRLPSMP